MMFWKRHRAESPRSRSHSVPQLWGGKQESLGREEKVRGTGLGKEGCVIVKRAFVCPGGRKRGMLASLPKAGAWLNLSGGRKQGRKRARSTGRLHRSSRAVTGRGPGQRSSFARLVGTWLYWGGWGSPLAAPTTALGSHTMPCTAPHRHSPVGSPGGACSEAGLEGSECLCAPEDTAKGAVGLLWLFPEGTRTCPEKLASANAASGTVSSPALLHHVLHKLRVRE